MPLPSLHIRSSVTTRARDIIIRSVGKVVRPKLDQPDQRHRLCSYAKRMRDSQENSTLFGPVREVCCW